LAGTKPIDFKWFSLIFNDIDFKWFSLDFQVQKPEQYRFLYACLASYMSPEENNQRDYIYTIYEQD
jgi:hypothetical protein